MPPITTLLHTRNDALRLGRALEMLLPCAEILIVDHHSVDATRRIARGIRSAHRLRRQPDRKSLSRSGSPRLDSLSQAHGIHYRKLAGNPVRMELTAWPGVVEGVADGSAFSVLVREQVGEEWVHHPTPETRLIHRSSTLWQGRLPAPAPSAGVLQGGLLRFTLP